MMNWTVVLRRIAALGAAFVLVSGLVRAQSITARGAAPLDAGRSAARELAIQDAVNQAALSVGARVESAEMLEGGRYRETGSLTASPLGGKVKVLSEYAEGGLYHVKIAIDTPDRAAEPARSASTDPSCAAPGGRSLRKKLVTTWFAVRDPADASDLTGLSTRLPSVLAERLGARPALSVTDAGGIGVLPDARMSDPRAGSDNVRLIGAKEGAQFVVAGRVVSTSVTSRFLRPTLFESHNTSQQGVYYDGPLSGILGGAVKYVPTERQFDAEIWLYDALTGAVLLNDRISTLARGGSVVPANPVPFGSAAFWRTDYGQAIDGLLDKAVAKLDATLSCIPFSAKVVEVDDTGKSYISAGGLDGLKVGDKLLLYRQQSRAAGNNPELGIAETLVGTVSLVQIQPRLSIAVAEGGGKAAQAGDIVRYQPKR
ncbi:flagellar assembly protein T N-terminal domain-containing protein [Paludibacterium paludis]|uniref:Flagellar assembly T-like protein n=1 Tax=Paludibacterium paludis TaxID=1225769 RepID=A0A918U8D3_9NEIS|nr:flagellar assembly protein T N-terminal domain-containing protein [Paludibacterium paludis]GGY10941.1 hypothetical protein GCM10011289_12210 [Paludibacterium paludis]